MTADRMIRVALTTFNRTPELANCSAQSIAQALMEAAQLGLEPDGVLGHAYLVPYQGPSEVHPWCRHDRPGLQLARSERLGAVVYANDKFDFAFGLNERLDHVPCMDGPRGEPRAVYAVARMKDGGRHGRAADCRSRTAAPAPAMPNSPAWKNDWGAMAVKTAVRQLSKWMPQCPELQRAAAREEAA
jgi:recombination protein RecT